MIYQTRSKKLSVYVQIHHYKQTAVSLINSRQAYTKKPTTSCQMLSKTGMPASLFLSLVAKTRSLG